MKEGATHKMQNKLTLSFVEGSSRPPSRDPEMQNKANFLCFQSKNKHCLKNIANSNPFLGFLGSLGLRFLGPCVLGSLYGRFAKRTQMESRHNENAKQSQNIPFSIKNQGLSKIKAKIERGLPRWHGGEIPISHRDKANLVSI
jgi:hypothetical protein